MRIISVMQKIPTWNIRIDFCQYGHLRRGFSGRLELAHRRSGDGPLDLCCPTCAGRGGSGSGSSRQSGERDAARHG
ncbi:hypothetical protein, partial [Limnoraphis robusta]|uniref:hypothetical protein n=1 Tax=Limnoraphis robusta TaxID=1118279 RepID=UPI002B20A8E0